MPLQLPYALMSLDEELLDDIELQQVLRRNRAEAAENRKLGLQRSTALGTINQGLQRNLDKTGGLPGLPDLRAYTQQPGASTASRTTVPVEYWEQGGPEDTPPPPEAARARAALELTAEENPDTEAELRRLAKAVGTTPDALRALPPKTLAQMRRAYDVESKTTETPVLARKYTSEDFARLAADDVGPLSKLETIFRATLGALPQLPGTAKVAGVAADVGAKTVGYLPKAPQAAGVGVGFGLAEGSAGFGQMTSEFLDDLFRPPEVIAFRNTFTPEEAEAIRARGFVPGKEQDPNAFLPRAAQWFEAGADELAAKRAELTPEAGNEVEETLNSAFYSLGAVLPAMAVGYVTKRPDISLGLMGMSSAGSAYREADDAGLSVIESTLHGVFTGAMEAGTESVGVGSFFSKLRAGDKGSSILFDFLTKDLVGEELNTVVTKIESDALLTPDKPFAQTLAELPRDMLDTAVATGITVGGLTTLGLAAREAEKRLRREQAEEEQVVTTSERELERLDDLVAAAAESKLLVRDPEAFAQTINEMAEESPLTHGYITPEALVQVAQAAGLAPEVLADQLGVADQVSASIATGAALQIPVGTILAKSGETYAQTLLQNLRTSTVTYSREELKALPADQKDQLQAVADRVAKAAMEDATFAEGIQTIRQSIEQGLTSVGRFVGEPNRLYATIAANGYGALAARLGITPTEAYQRYPLNITGERITGEVSRQDTEPMLELRHYSSVPGITQTDPSLWGDNVMLTSKAERNRKGSAPNRTYFGLDVGKPGGYVKERNTGDNEYFAYVPAASLYDFEADPEGLRPAGDMPASERASAYERAIQAAGYAGYWTNSRMGRVAAVFDPVELSATARGPSFGQPAPAAMAAAQAYMDSVGRPLLPAVKVKVDVARAERIAVAFEEMAHAPNDPEVRAAYDAMIAETMDQWRVIKDVMGLQVEFIDGADPYASPHDAVRDIAENNHLWVFSTEAGYGQTGITDADRAENPLLAETGETISGRPALANDIFRIVHDVFGHAKDGAGFRASGEENAWRSHVVMYSPLAARAMTSKTRGQNSWLNYGPHGEKNRTAKTEETVFAEQKIGLLPEWVMTEGSPLTETLGQPGPLAAEARRLWGEGLDRAAVLQGLREFATARGLTPSEDTIRVTATQAQKTNERLSPGEQQIAQLSAAGRSAESIAAELFPGNPAGKALVRVALRKAATLGQDRTKGKGLFQPRRGEYAPSTNTLGLLKTADLSTFLHEMGHHFLEVNIRAATDIQARQRAGEALRPGEQSLLNDYVRWIEHAAKELGSTAGKPGEGLTYASNALQWSFDFFESVIDNPTERQLDRVLRKMLQDKKLPAIRLLKDPATGEITAFDGATYTHADARELLSLGDKLMLHGMYQPGTPLSETIWYDQTGRLDGADSYGQLDPASFKKIREATLGDVLRWYVENVDENVVSGETVISFKSTEMTAAGKPRKNKDVTIKIYGDIDSGVSVDMYYQGRVSADADPSPRAAREAQIVFNKTVAALQAWVAYRRPAHIQFTGATQAHNKLYEFMLRNFEFGGYEARVSKFHVAWVPPVDPGEMQPSVSSSFYLVRPDLAPSFVSQQERTDVYESRTAQGEIREYVKEARRVQILRPGRDVRPVGPADAGRGGSGEPDPSAYGQGPNARSPQEITNDEITNAANNLTDGEFQAWKLARAGLSNKAIVDALNLAGDGENVTNEASVRVLLSKARSKGFDAPRAVTGRPGGMSPETMRVVQLLAAGDGHYGENKEIAERVYGDPKKAQQVAVLKTRHADLIAQQRQRRSGQSYGQGPGWYSALQRAVEGIKMASAQAAQWKATIKALPGVKAEEIEWTGLFDWLDSIAEGSYSPVGPEVETDGKIARALITEFLYDNGVQVEEIELRGADPDGPEMQDAREQAENEFSDYFWETWEGGGYYVKEIRDLEPGDEGYKDELVRWGVYLNGQLQDTFETEREAEDVANDRNIDEGDDAFEAYMHSRRYDIRQRVEELFAEESGSSVQFQDYALEGGRDYTELLLTLPGLQAPSTHWNDQSGEVVAHVRFDTRKGPKGERVLAIQEIQSDWHQAGREQGYKQKTPPALIEEAAQAKAAALKAWNAADQQLHDYLQSQDGMKDLVGSSPSKVRADAKNMRDGLFVYKPSPEQLQILDELIERSFTAGQAYQDANSRLFDLQIGRPDPVLFRAERETFAALEEARQRLGEAYVSAELARFDAQIAANPGALEDAQSERIRLRRIVLDRVARDRVRVADFDVFDAETRDQLIALNDLQNAARLRHFEAQQAYERAREGVPDAPFKGQGWVNLVLKRMIRYAAENGYDTLAWVPGNVKNGDILGEVRAEALRYREENGEPVYQAEEQGAWLSVPGFPAELLKQVKAQPEDGDGHTQWRTLQLPEPMTIRNNKGWQFYDEIVPNLASKLVKKYDAKVETIDLPQNSQSYIGSRTLRWHAVHMTPKLKAEALKGMPLFQNGDAPKPARPMDPGADALDWWNGLSFKEKEPYHELFARQTEAYFMEGKAPVPEMKGLFATFKRWMYTVYNSLKDLNAELTDEVRGVLDRTYAAHFDIAEAERKSALQPMFAVKPEYMTDSEWEEYQRLNAQSVEDAQDALAARSLRDLKWLSNAKSRAIRKLQAEAREQRKAMRAEIEAEVMAEPVNRVRMFLARGVGADNEPFEGPHKLNADDVNTLLADDVPRDRFTSGKYGLVAKDGLNPALVADMFGYLSASIMLQDLAYAEPYKEKIAGLIDQRMLERYGDLNDDDAINAAADEAVHEGLRGKVLAAEYAALTAAAGNRRMIHDAAKDTAAKLVQRMPAMQLSPLKFQAAERRAGKAAETALRKNDLAGAAAAKRDQLLNFYINAEVRRQLRDRDKALALFRRILAAKRDLISKSRNFDLVQAARAVLAAHGMARLRNDPMSYLATLKQYDPSLYAALEPQLLQALTAGRKLKDLSVEQFLGMRDVVTQMWELAREEMLIEIDGQKIEKKAVVDELNQRLEDRGADGAGVVTEAPTDWQRTLRQFEGMAASLRRVESWTRMVDGGVGPFTKYVWRPISEAADRYRLDRNDYVRRYRELFRGIEDSLTSKQIAAPELGYTFAGKAELLHAVLHTGNASNLRKLLLGRRWGQEKADGSLDTSKWEAFLARMYADGTLAKADYDWAQSVWDLLDSTKPLAQKAHRAVFGHYFSEITAAAITTPFGTYAGGYVPAVYDDYHVQDAVLRAEQEAIEANDSTMFPAPASGFTQSRVEYNRELQLDLRLLSSHIDKVLKFSHMAVPVRGVLRLLRTESFKRMLQSYHPTAATDMLMPWLQRAARQSVETPLKGQGGRAADRFGRAIRRRAGMGLMFANLVNVLQQLTGFSLAALRTPKRYLALGLTRYLRNPAGVHAAIRAASPFMAERADRQSAAMHGELQDIILAKGPLEKTSAWFGRHAYFMQTAVQNVMDIVIWQGAYEHAKAKGSSEIEAARVANGVIRETQGTMNAEDISRFESGDALWRIVTQMYGYFNMWGNLLSTEFRTAARDMGLRKGAGRLFYVYFMGFAVPAVVAQLIADGLRGNLPEDDDDEPLGDWLGWLFGTQVKTSAAFVPLAGQAAMAGVNAWNSNPLDDRIANAPSVSVLEAAVRTPKNVYDAMIGEGDASRAAKDTLTLLTLASGLPFQALGRPVGYALDVWEGDVTPENEADFVRGLVTGSATPASRN